MIENPLDSVDVEYILKQLEKMETGRLKKESVEAYASRALKGKNRNLNDYLTFQVINALYKYRRQNRGD